MFVDISKVFTERQIDITSMNVRTSKQGKATIIMTFDIHGIEELNRLTDKLRQIRRRHRYRKDCPDSCSAVFCVYKKEQIMSNFRIKTYVLGGVSTNCYLTFREEKSSRDH